MVLSETVAKYAADDRNELKLQNVNVQIEGNTCLNLISPEGVDLNYMHNYLTNIYIIVLITFTLK